MKFQDKYSIIAGEKDKDGKDKIVISDDAFAIGDMIQEILGVLNSK